MLVHGGMAQNVGPILEMVTEKYLLRSEAEWQARRQAMGILDEILGALRAGDVQRIGAPPHATSPTRSRPSSRGPQSFHRNPHRGACARNSGDDFWGFWMLGGMSGGGMGFIFEPEHRARAQERLGIIMAGLVRLEVIGQVYRLPEAVQEHLKKSIATLSRNNGLTLIMALSYGGRTEIVDAVRSIAQKVKAGELDPPDITEEVFAQHLYTRNVPDPDVLIRTSGEMRVSNFLLWQISYTELVVTPTLWPDFRKPQFYAALEEYNRRHRRFGACDLRFTIYDLRVQPGCVSRVIRDRKS